MVNVSAVGQRVLATALIAAIAVWLLAKAETLSLHQPAIARTAWYEQGPGAPHLAPHCNFYTTSLDDHPLFGMVMHTTDKKAWDRESDERETVLAAVRICREQFATAFHESRITAWDTLGTNRSRWQGNVPQIQWQPRWILVIVRNLPDYDDIRRSGARDISQLRKEVLLKPYKVGYVISAALLFDGNTSFDDVVARGFRSEVPIDFDPVPGNPAGREVYPIIEEFENTTGP